MEQAASETINPEKPFQENVHQALYRMLEFRLEHQLTIKLAQEQRDFGTPVVENVMKKLEKSILLFIQSKIEQAMKRNVIKPCDPEIISFMFLKMYVALVFVWMYERESVVRCRP